MWRTGPRLQFCLNLSAMWAVCAVLASSSGICPVKEWFSLRKLDAVCALQEQLAESTHPEHCFSSRDSFQGIGATDQDPRPEETSCWCPAQAQKTSVHSSSSRAGNRGSCEGLGNWGTVCLEPTPNLSHLTLCDVAMETCQCLALLCARV